MSGELGDSKEKVAGGETDAQARRPEVVPDMSADNGYGNGVGASVYDGDFPF